MKVDYCDEKVIIYLVDNYSEDLEELCFDIVDKLNKFFDIQLKGFYDVEIYRDINYGTVLEFTLEQSDLYIDFTKIDLHISDYNNYKFLYEIDDIFDIDVKKIYLYNNKIYTPIDKLKIENIEFGKLVYKNTDVIIHKSKVIDM